MWHRPCCAKICSIRKFANAIEYESFTWTKISAIAVAYIEAHQVGYKNMRRRSICWHTDNDTACATSKNWWSPLSLQQYPPLPGFMKPSNSWKRFVLCAVLILPSIQQQKHTSVHCFFLLVKSHYSHMSAGITAWEVLTFCNPPYYGVKGPAMLGLLKAGQRLPQPSAASNDLYAVMLQCKVPCRDSFFSSNLYQSLVSFHRPSVASYNLSYLEWRYGPMVLYLDNTIDSHLLGARWPGTGAWLTSDKIISVIPIDFTCFFFPLLYWPKAQQTP